MQELLSSAAMTMATGMIAVFIFLVLLIGAVKLLQFWVGDTVEPSAADSSSGISPRKLAAIAAAVRHYRNS